MLRTSNDEALQDWRVQFDAIFNHLPVGIAYLTTDMRYVRINPYLENKLGKKSEEVRGLHCYDVVGTYRDDPARAGQERICDGCGIKKTLAEGVISRHTRHVRPDFVVENMGVPVLGPTGKVLGAAEIILDVTEQAEMEKRLLEYAAKLEVEVEEKAHEKEEFIAVLAHDLKSPLTSIIGYSSLLMEGAAGSLQGDLRACAEGVQANAQRMLGLVRNMLSADRIEAITARDPVPIDLESLTFECLRNMGPQVRDKALKVETSFDKGVPEVLADRELIERAVTNLITNAVKFTPQGGVITLAIGSRDGRVFLEVTDTGVGIPKEELPMLFEKYYQGKSGRRSTGTGLGLFIAKKIVEAYKGRISVSSLEGNGATFTMELPSTP